MIIALIPYKPKPLSMILFQNFQGFTLFSYQGSLAPVCPTGQLKHIITFAEACQQ